MSDAPHKPQCIGIIMDGNRRWAKENGLSSFEGHKRGMENVEIIARVAQDIGIQHAIIYAFSTENWTRSQNEISYLFELFESMAKDKLVKFTDSGVAVRFVGQRERFPTSLQKVMLEVESKNSKNPKNTLWICLSYGSKAEITQAAQAASLEGEITEDSIAKHLWTAGMPDPDIIIRTGGQERISNFLLWQGAYSELFFLKKHWPAFTEADLKEIVTEYGNRDRRMGR